jgi:methylmalonyl-CoA mutase N-terminal domain/subunit
MEVESAAKKIVGVNFLRDAKQQKIVLHRINPRAVAKQIRGVKTFRRRRSGQATSQSLKNLKRALTESQNLVPLIIEAVKSHATTGEISDALRETYGEFHPKTIV